MLTDLGVDLGTRKTVIVRGKKIVLNQPSVVLMEEYDDSPYKFGKEAFEAIGRAPGRYRTVCPIERGVISDYAVAEHMLRCYIQYACGSRMTKPRVVVSMPANITWVQKRSIVDAVQNAGGRSVCTIEAPVAAALGMGIDFKRPRGTIVVDIGAGTTDVAVISMGGLSKCESARVAGSDIDAAIVDYMKHEYNMLIGEHTAEFIKCQVGAAIPRPVEIAIQAKGVNASTGMPQSVEITANEICEAISDVVYRICGAVRDVLDKTPPELVGDIAEDGIYLCGGTSQLSGMADCLANYIGIKVTTAENYQTCVAKGIGSVLEHFDILQNGDYEFSTLQDLIIG